MSNLKLVVYNSVMEFANRWPSPPDVDNEDIFDVRVARKSDAVSISRLLNSTQLVHMHVDWHMPVDWLGEAGFMVAPQVGRAEGNERHITLVEPREQLLACLAVTADPLPAAWVRLTAVSPKVDVAAVLSEMFARVVDVLRETAVTEIGWLVLNPWPLPYLPALGFQQLTMIETYRKDDLETPPVIPAPDLVIRPVAEGDFERLAMLETAVFAPLWRFSASTLRLAWREAIGFDVALAGEQIVGYQISSGGRFGAHLVRMAISPDVQGQGVGSALLAHTTHGYRAQGYDHITLNTQVDNPSSHHLYEKFGFRATGEKMPLWVMSF